MITLLALVQFTPAEPPDSPVTPIRRTHAHNDYEHKHPLFDALDQGFCSVEADIWINKDGVLVATRRSTSNRKEPSRNSTSIPYANG